MTCCHGECSTAAQLPDSVPSHATGASVVVWRDAAFTLTVEWTRFDAKESSLASGKSAHLRRKDMEHKTSLRQT